MDLVIAFSIHFWRNFYKEGERWRNWIYIIYSCEWYKCAYMCNWNTIETKSFRWSIKYDWIVLGLQSPGCWYRQEPLPRVWEGRQLHMRRVSFTPGTSSGNAMLPCRLVTGSCWFTICHCYLSLPLATASCFHRLWFDTGNPGWKWALHQLACICLSTFCLHAGTLLLTRHLVG